MNKLRIRIKENKLFRLTFKLFFVIVINFSDNDLIITNINIANDKGSNKNLPKYKINEIKRIEVKIILIFD